MSRLSKNMGKIAGIATTAIMIGGITYLVERFDVSHRFPIIPIGMTLVTGVGLSSLLYSKSDTIDNDLS